MAAGCSFTFDSSGDVWPLVGAPVDTTAAQRLRVVNGQAPQLVVGVDGATWATTGVALGDSGARLGLVRLGSPATSEFVDQPADSPASAGRIDVGRSALYSYLPWGVLVHRPGGAEQFIKVDAPSPWVDLQFSYSPTDAAHAFVDDAALHLRRADGSNERLFPRRTMTVDDWVLSGWSDDGDFAVLSRFSEADRQFTFEIVDTRSNAVVSLSPGGRTTVPPLGLGVTVWLGWLADPPTALLCSAARGLWAVPLDGGEPSLLDPRCFSFPTLVRVCGPDPAFDCDGIASSAFENLSLDVPQSAARITYQVEGQGPDGGEPRVVRAVALAGGRASETPVPPGDLTALAPPHVATYPEGTLYHRYAFGIPADVDGQPAMERGRALAFSRDGTRLRFLEHTADLDGAGDLMAGPVGGPYQRVARNAVRHDELDDGRLIAVTNMIYGAGGARVVVVDEAAGTVTRVLEGADQYVVLPGTGEALVRMQSADAAAPDAWVRVALPRRGR